MSPAPHADHPHEPGRLHGCPACESACHCGLEEAAECVYDGAHAGAHAGASCAQCGGRGGGLAPSEHGLLCTLCAYRQLEHDDSRDRYDHLAPSSLGFISDDE